MAVNKTRVRALIRALRSGTYQQGRGALVNWGFPKPPIYLHHQSQILKHCCLGVATDLAKNNRVFGLLIQLRDVNVWGGNGELEKSVRAWYGFESADPVLKFLRADVLRADALVHGGDAELPLNVEDSFMSISAIAANDKFLFGFDQIADAFERTFVPEDVAA